MKTLKTILATSILAAASFNAMALDPDASFLDANGEVTDYGTWLDDIKSQAEVDNTGPAGVDASMFNKQFRSAPCPVLNAFKSDLRSFHIDQMWKDDLAKASGKYRKTCAKHEML